MEPSVCSFEVVEWSKFEYVTNLVRPGCKKTGINRTTGTFLKLPTQPASQAAQYYSMKAS